MSTATLIIITGYVLVGLAIGYPVARSVYNDVNNRDYYHQGGWCFMVMLLMACIWPVALLAAAVMSLGEGLSKVLKRGRVGERLFGRK